MIKLSGGFHQVSPMTIRWQPGESISKNQFDRIQKHFCGIPGCICCGAMAGFLCDPPNVRDEFTKALCNPMGKRKNRRSADGLSGKTGHAKRINGSRRSLTN